MEKSIKIFFIFLLLSGIVTVNSFSKNIAKKNYFTVSYDILFPGSTTEKIVNDRVGKGVTLFWENYSFFKKFPLLFTFSYNEWERGSTNYLDWQDSRITNYEIGVGYLYETSKRIFLSFGLKYFRWRIEKDGKFFVSSTKLIPDGEIGFKTKNNWVFSLKGIGYTHITKDIRFHYFGFSFGKRF